MQFQVMNEFNKCALASMIIISQPIYAEESGFISHRVTEQYLDSSTGEVRETFILSLVDENPPSDSDIINLSNDLVKRNLNLAEGVFIKFYLEGTQHLLKPYAELEFRINKGFIKINRCDTINSDIRNSIKIDSDPCSTYTLNIEESQ